MPALWSSCKELLHTNNTIGIKLAICCARNRFQAKNSDHKSRRSLVIWKTRKMEGTYTFVADQKWDQKANPPAWHSITGITEKPSYFIFSLTPPQRPKDHHSNHSSQQDHTSRWRTNLQRTTHPVKRAWHPRVWVEWGTLCRRTVLDLYGRISRVHSFWIRSACNIKAPRTPHQSVKVTSNKQLSCG